MHGDSLDPTFDPDDYENRQKEAEETPLVGGGSGSFDNIFDGAFNGAARSEMYRAAVTPDLFPHEKPFRVENWDDEEREVFCGIYPDTRRTEIQIQTNVPQRYIMGVTIV